MLRRVMPSFAVIFALACTLAGCGGAGLSVSTWNRADVEPGAARDVRVVDGEGRRESVARAQDDAFAALTDGGFYRAFDDTRAALDVDETGAHLDGDTFTPSALYLRLDVLENFAEISEDARDGVDDWGNPVTVIVDVTHAHAVVDATLVRGDGTVLLDRVEVEGIHDEDGDVEDESRDAAMKDAVDEIIAKITPKRASDFVPFDDRDQSERPILDKAQQGDLSAALDDEDAYIKSHDALAAPRYNRAVMLDSEGQFAAALAGYDDALAHHPDAKLRDLVDDARAGCLARQESAQSLGL